MKFIPLTQGKRACVDDEDLDWLMAMGSWHYLKKRGCARGGDGKTMMHRTVAERHGIAGPGDNVKHMDGDRLNNQRSNLRVVNRTQQAAGRKKYRGKVSYKGVSYDATKDRYRATIWSSGKWYHLGWFGNARDAARRYNDAAFLFFGEYAKLNEVP